MAKKILTYSYWLGVVCVVIAIGWRAANFMGYFLGNVVPGVTITYMSFFKAALLLLLISIATAGMLMAEKQ
jgi:hypothetical protein